MIDCFDIPQKPIPQYQSLKHGTSVYDFLKEHRPNNPNIVIVGFHSGKIFYDGNVDDVPGFVQNKVVVMAHPDLKKYAYFCDYNGEDKDSEVYLIVATERTED
jgi:hypothetical protein